MSQPNDLSNNIISSQDIRSLRAYISLALKLPVTPTQYAREFRIDESIKQKLDTLVDSSAAINKTIQDNCQTFDNTTFKDMMHLIRDVKGYAEDAKLAFSPLCHSLKEIDDARRTDSKPDPIHLKAVKEWVAIHKPRCTENLDNAKRVSDGLHDFANKTTIDQGNADREMNFLEGERDYIAQEAIEQTGGRLTIAVEQLKKLGEASSNVDEPKLVPLVGLVPQRVINCPPGKSYYDAITELLKSRDGPVILERVSLTCEMMRVNWKKILDLLIPAKRTVQGIQGFFESLRSDLETIERRVNSIERFPSLMYIGMSEDDWKRLADKVDDLLKGAFKDFEQV